MNSLTSSDKPILARRSSAELPAGNSAAHSLFADPSGSPHNISAQPTSRADHAFFQNRQMGQLESAINRPRPGPGHAAILASFQTAADTSGGRLSAGHMIANSRAFCNTSSAWEKSNP